jgi:hypothetical protein
MARGRVVVPLEILMSRPLIQGTLSRGYESRSREGQKLLGHYTQKEPDGESE